MNIRNKISIVFLILVIPLIIVGFLTFNQLNIIAKPINNQIPKQIQKLSENSTLENLSQSIRYYDEVLTQSARNYAFTKNVKWKNRYLETVPKLDIDINKAIELGDSADKKTFQETNIANQSLIRMEEDSIRFVDKNMEKQAISILDGKEYWAQKEIYSSALKEFADRRETQYEKALDSSINIINETTQKTETLINNSIKVNILVIGVFVLISIFLGFLTAYFITRPINDLLIGIKKVEKGDLDNLLENNSHDEIGQLSQSLNKMTISLKKSKDEIDKKVEEQTKDISKKTKVLEGQQKAILNVLEDVEEEKNKSNRLAEDLQKFQLAVANASDHIVITDSEGIILYANRAVETITGFNPQKIIGKKAGSPELWGGLMSKSVYEKFWNKIKNEKKAFTGEFNNHRQNGENYIAEAHVSPVLNSNNQVQFFIGIERDVTKAKEVDRMKTEFISLASHQLRTPLSAMKWFCEMLLNGDAGKLNKEQIEYLQNVYQSNERMIALVNSLLNVSRIESGRIIIDPKPTDLGKLVKEELMELDNKIKEKKITLILSVHPQLPLINIDPKLIREVYKNFLTNSIKYTPAKGEISIFISKKNNEIISQISDTGYGIPKKEQSKVFQKLYRGENIIKIETDGNGLGLYLAKSIVDSSGGKIWFKSVEGKGSSFWFSLPLSGSRPKKGEVTVDS